MFNNTLLRALVGASALLLVPGCGGTQTETAAESLAFSAVNPRASSITDTSVHLTCQTIGAEPASPIEAQVLYTYGIADAEGVAQPPLYQLLADAGQADIKGLTPDTTYTVTFTAVLNGKEASFSPTLSFHTMKPLDPTTAFLIRVLPGVYAQENNGSQSGPDAWLSLVQVSDPSCASGIGLIGVDSAAFNWVCMDFQNMSATRTVGENVSNWKIDVCDCGLVGADFGQSVQTTCESLPQVSCPALSGSNFELRISGGDQFNGQTFTATYLKRPGSSKK